MKTKLFHYLLVGVQFGILAFYVISQFEFPDNWIAILVLLDAILLGIWAIVSMGLSTISAFPDVRDKAVLTKKMDLID